MFIFFKAVIKSHISLILTMEFIGKKNLLTVIQIAVVITVLRKGTLFKEMQCYCVKYQLLHLQKADGLINSIHQQISYNSACPELCALHQLSCLVCY